MPVHPSLFRRRALSTFGLHDSGWDEVNNRAEDILTDYRKLLLPYIQKIEVG